MILEELLGQLNGVRRAPTGFVAFCPSHDGRRPKLAIREGERGILLKCWIGCELATICAAIGIRVADLFYESRTNSNPHDRVPRAPAQPPRIDWKGYGHQVQWYADEFFLRGEQIFAMARKLDPSAVTAEEFDLALEAVHSGFCDLEESERLADLAVNLKQFGLEEERSQNAARH